jgi:hypothetical protein
MDLHDYLQFFSAEPDSDVEILPSRLARIPQQQGDPIVIARNVSKRFSALHD